MSVIKFRVNGKEHTVGGDLVSSDVMLLDYLRNYLQLRGTKYMCREGGCGACMVTASKTTGSPLVAVNSCLATIGSCHGWDIWTIEGLGNKKDGYSTLQTTMAETCATQCGYCTPGFTMAMHGLMESNSQLTMLEIEKSMSSNICRCTGYRPIIEAFKKFAVDAPAEYRVKNVKNMCVSKKSAKCCQNSEDDWCMVRQDDLHADETTKIVLKDGKIWYRPATLTDVFSIMYEHSESYMLVAGDTSKGAYPITEYPDAMIYVSHLTELRSCTYDQNCVVGAGLTLTEFMDILKAGATQENFSYFSTLRDHVDMVAHIPVRNVGTIAGNLMIKHAHNVYQSDIYVIFATVGAQLTIKDWNGGTEVVTMANFLKLDMKGKVIMNVLLPPLSSSYKIFTYKLMPRSQSAHAIVNFGFLCKLNDSNVVEEASIVYGALSENFERATATQTYLVGKSLFTNDTVQGSIKVLDGEMIVDDNPPEPSAEYRRYIAKALFYKAILAFCPSVATRCQSATVNLHLTRPCSSASQTCDTDTSLWPLTQPIPKLESAIQCAGEAQYTEDIPSYHNEVFGAFALCTSMGTIIKIDPSEALALSGVIAFYTAKDIPGLNSYTPADGAFTSVNQEVLCEGTVKYYGQPFGIIVADTQFNANRAAELVKVTYSNVTTPVLDIKVAKADSSRNTLYASVDATATGTDVYKTMTGSNVLRGQYHCPMETIVCVAIPTEQGIEVHMPTQWLDGPHTMISRALNIEQNKIDLHVRRCGGSYGLKINCSTPSAIACCLIVQKLNLPCRFIQPLTTNMKSFGKRMPNVTDYEVAVNASGVVQYINTYIYLDNGYKINEPIAAYGYDEYYNCYDATKMNYKSYNTITDTPKNTFCRSPGTLEAVANIENIMERISYELSMDPISVRLANLDTTNYGEMTEVVEALKTSANFTSRRAAVDSFNTQNRWKKRGLRWALCRWPTVGGMYQDVNLSVYHADASVVITHGGVEMGQGINTKIAQVAAYLLKIPLDKIEIKPNSTLITPNSYVTGGSVSCDALIIALTRCIEQLQTRLEPVKATLTDPTWAQVITAAYAANVDLQAHGFVSSSDAQSYNIYGAACCEVELDVLTGEFEVLRVDISQDVGTSISPHIDIGQIEGAFMMGVGYWTCEKLIFDPTTGELLTNRTWDYDLPEARDIPQELKIVCRKSYSTKQILGSKAVGEPPICLSIVVPLAIREAIAQARQENGIPTTEWFDIDGAFSTEKISLATKNNTEDFKLT